MIIAVIIPYFQTDAGILSRAVDSIASQVLPQDTVVQIIVIDDASPHPASVELAQFSETPTLSLAIMQQPNGGPGQARNCGLDHVKAAGNVDFVAFLDSDDIWAPQHLSDALELLERGYDFYCCDNTRPGSFERFSEDVPVLRNGGEALAAYAQLHDPAGPKLGFAPHALDDQFVTSYLSHTSTVVVRAQTVRDIRFDPDLRSASEDRMFWISVALSGARIAISWACNVTCGRGVNLFFSAYDWNSPATVERVGCQLLFAEKLMRQPALNQVRLAFALDRARISRRAYAFLFIRMMLKLKRPPLKAFRRLLRFDPWLPLKMPGLFVTVMVDRRPDARQF